MIPQAQTTEAVTRAIETGYRSLDSASEYGNEIEVGRAIAAAEVPRDELFVTTKLWNSDHGREKTLRAFDASLNTLGLEHVDLYLIHWPVPAWDLYVETWKALVEIQQDGTRTLDRRVELPDPPPRAHRRGDGGRARGQPDRAPPAASAARASRLPRAGRHRHRGVEPARPGHGAEPPDRTRARRAPRTVPRPDRSALASAAGKRRDTEVRHAAADRRELRRCSTSSSTSTRWVSCRPSTRARGPGRTRTRSSKIRPGAVPRTPEAPGMRRSET